jgi:hypothetical protein
MSTKKNAVIVRFDDVMFAKLEKQAKAKDLPLATFIRSELKKILSDR